MLSADSEPPPLRRRSAGKCRREQRQQEGTVRAVRHHLPFCLIPVSIFNSTRDSERRQELVPSRHVERIRGSCANGAEAEGIEGNIQRDQAIFRGPQCKRSWEPGSGKNARCENEKGAATRIFLGGYSTDESIR